MRSACGNADASSAFVQTKLVEEEGKLTATARADEGVRDPKLQSLASIHSCEDGAQPAFPLPNSKPTFGAKLAGKFQYTSQTYIGWS